MHYLLLPYLILFLLLFTFIINDENDKIKVIGIRFFLIVALIFFLFAMLMQPLTGDNGAYSRNFIYLSQQSFTEMIHINGDVGFKFTNWIVGQFTTNYLLYSFALAIGYFVIFNKALRNIYSSYERDIIFFSYILYPYSIAFIIHGKRQGLALVFMFLAITFFMRNKNKQGIIALIPVGLFHSGSLIVIPFIALFVFLKEKNVLKYSIIFFTFSLLVSILGLNKSLLDLVPSAFSLDPRHLAYFEVDGAFSGINYRVGFRPDFALFSIFPLVLYIYFRKRIKEKEKKRVEQWVSVYLLLNSIYNFFSIVPFNDRFAAFSWFLLPIVCYEILRSINKQYAILLSLFIFFIGVILLQVYTSKYFLPLGLY